MTPHPLDTAAMRHYRRWMAKGNRTQAETSLRRMLAREANLPAAHSALARLRWHGCAGPDPTTAPGWPGCIVSSPPVCMWKLAWNPARRWRWCSQAPG